MFSVGLVADLAANRQANRIGKSFVFFLIKEIAFCFFPFRGLEKMAKVEVGLGTTSLKNKIPQHVHLGDLIMVADFLGRETGREPQVGFKVRLRI